jgi:hypothetical protein
MERGRVLVPRAFAAAKPSLIAFDGRRTLELLDCVEHVEKHFKKASTRFRPLVSILNRQKRETELCFERVKKTS